MFHGHRFYAWSRSRRPFWRGAFKYIILHYLKDKPSYGYEIIQALETLSGGLYTPSAGTIYPTLQMLEDMDYLTSSVQDGKRIYSITDKGRQFLAERGDLEERMARHMKRWWGSKNVDEIRAAMQEMGKLATLLSSKAHTVEAEKFVRIREVLSRAYQDVENVLKD